MGSRPWCSAFVRRSGSGSGHPGHRWRGGQGRYVMNDARAHEAAFLGLAPTGRQVEFDGIAIDITRGVVR